MIEKEAVWRERCRTLAHERAEKEVRAALHLQPEEPIPFNYRWEHVQRVVQVALWLAERTGADREIVEAAAWLHDIRKGEPNHDKIGAVEAGALLQETDFPPEKIAGVVDAIDRHAGLTRAPGAPPLEPLETAVLWDADKLTKLGVSMIAYQLSTREFDGASLAERRQEMQKFLRTVLSKTVESMNTAPARHLAQVRYRAMASFLDEWESEDKL
ncbi:HD domain-containing protein [Caldilinea sp.]|jgi:uncharacterized protein|uniref:HD domain-containing protein n=1 Tax=Caldilinea sp. TaxID=2293560 RepID=UPI002636A098|nr:HD domain-containing protein [uncultured Caldilinea sp.]